MNDKQLTKLLLSDPAEGIREAIGAYGGILTAVVMRILKNKQEAEECVADTFVSLWKNIRTLKKADSLKGYLICIARNNAINRYHKLKNHSSLYVEDIEGFEITADDDVELLVIKNEFMDELQGLVMKLPEPGREIFMRKYFLFEPISDIAAKVGLNEVQVKDRLYRMRKQIRSHFEKSDYDYKETIFAAVQ